MRIRVQVLTILWVVWATTAQAMNGEGLARVRELNSMGRFREAEIEARSLLGTVEDREDDTLETAHVLDELSVAMRRGGKLQSGDALMICERSLRIKKRLLGEGNPDVALSLHHRGVLRAYRGEYTLARIDLENALSIRERCLGKGHPEAAATLIPLSHVYRQEGDAAGARRLIERAIAILEVSPSEDASEMMRALLILGYILYDSGDYPGAGVAYDRALDSATRLLPPAHPDVGICHQNIGALLSETGDYDLAREHYHLALSIRRKSLGSDHPLVANSLEALGHLAETQRKYKEARAHYEEASRIQERVLGTSHPQVARLWTRLAGMEIKTGDLHGAQKRLQHALEVQEATLGQGHPDLAWTLDKLGAAEEAGDSTERALTYYERSLDLRTRAYGSRHPDVGVSLSFIAPLQERMGNHGAAIDAALEAAAIDFDNFWITSSVLSERHALAFSSIQSRAQDLALSLITRDVAHRHGDVRRVWNAWIRSRNAVLGEMASRHRSIGQSGDSVLVGLRAELDRCRHRLSQRLVRGPGDDPAKIYRNDVDALRREVERAEQRLAMRSDIYRKGARKTVLGYDEVAEALPSESALIAYAWFGEGKTRRYAAFVLPAGHAPRVIALDRGSSIEALVQEWHRLASKPGKGRSSSEASARNAGERLRAAVWDPIAKLLGAERRIFIVPDGDLHRVNFGALPHGPGYLIEVAPLIHYLAAERDLVVDLDEASIGTGLLALGGPSFDGTTRGVHSGREDARVRGAGSECVTLADLKFEPLPGTLQEVRDIVSLWGSEDNVTIRTGAGATESAVRSESAGRRVIHFATHGFFLDGTCAAPITGTRSISATIPSGKSKTPTPAKKGSTVLPTLAGLALTGANLRSDEDAVDDGILTVEEIMSLNLRGVEWVVLSACDTGVGRPQAGEGILGMQRAFQIAGARTVIMSLWAVDDIATRGWMRKLYEQRIRKHQGTAEAVRQASVGVLQERRAQGLSTLPFHWAGFVASGHWN